MKCSDLLRHLRAMSACSDAIEWVECMPGKLTDLWATCHRGDWMLWLAARSGIKRQRIVLAACDCAEQALRYVPAGEDQSLGELAEATLSKRPAEQVVWQRRWYP